MEEIKWEYIFYTGYVERQLTNFCDGLGVLLGVVNQVMHTELYRGKLMEGSHLKEQWEVSIKMDIVEVGYDDVKWIEVGLNSVTLLWR
jgi:hypothetical protein